VALRNLTPRLSRLFAGKDTSYSAEDSNLPICTPYSRSSNCTVYKTLKILKELGLVQELNFPQGQTRFDSYMKPHINLVCLRCGKIRDLDDLTAQEIVGRVATAAKFTVVGQRLDLYGVCEKCTRVKPRI
jgi:Fe2+ or Zn2+ uptake regulation protein